MNILTFDIETVPDVETGRRLYGLEGLNDGDAARVMRQKRLEQTGGESDFLRHHLQRIVAISAALRRGDSLRIWSLGELDSPEGELIRRFFEGIDKFTPTLVSWNGGGFDLPVLHYRSLLHGVPAPRYWETGNEDRDFRFNNYLSRYHSRHTDLMDVLSGYTPRAGAPLDEIAVLLGFPGKMGQSGANVWVQYQDGKIEEIRNYCETDVVNTYLIYLRFELVRGNLDEDGWKRETQLLRDTLKSSGKPYLQEFLSAWKGPDGGPGR